MLTIFCGDDTVASRNKLTRARERFASQGYEIIQVDPSEIERIQKDGGLMAVSLFGRSAVYETTHLVPVYRRKYQKKTKEVLRQLASDQNIILIDWETKSSYDLGLESQLFVDESRVKENTFTLLPNCKPGNGPVFIKKLHDLTKTQPIEVTFAMLVRHVRNMLMISIHKRPKDAPFLVKIAQTCVKSWDMERLQRFYYQLLKVEVNTKSGYGTPLDLHQQIDVLSALML
jgi:hypothetical protein